MRVTVANLKGGTGKTTTAVALALGLARVGRVLLVDADPQAASASDWSGAAGEAWPDAIVVVPWADASLGKRIRQVAGDYEHVIVDTGGESALILRAALMVTDHLVVPVAPSVMELRRIPATFALAGEVDAVSPVLARVLLVKIRAGTRSALEARALLEGEGLPVMDAQVSLWESYAAMFGTVPGALGEYEHVLAELASDVGLTFLDGGITA